MSEWITVLGTIGGALGGTCITNYYVDKREKTRLKNDFLAKIRILMTLPIIELFKNPYYKVPTNQIVADFEKFENDFKTLSYGYHKFNDNSKIFEQMLTTLHSFIYQVRCHRGGEMKVIHNKDGSNTYNPTNKAYIIRIMPFGENEDSDAESFDSEVIKIFDDFIIAVNDLPNTLK